MTDTDKLKIKMKNERYNVSSLSKKTNICRQSLAKKLKGKMDFTVSEICKLCDALNISYTDMPAYFFTGVVPKTETCK